MAEEAVLRFAIVGTGAMGLEHIRNLKLLANTQVTACADGDERARHEAGLLVDKTACAVMSDYRDLDPSTFDAIILATPNFSHIDILRVVIPWKKHLLVEKPMCTVVGDCMEVQALLDEHMRQDAATIAKGGPIYWVGMEYRYMPPIAKLLSIVDAGSLGKLHMVHIREHRFPFLLKVADWNRFSKLTGGTLVEKCCHFWDLMRRIVGPDARALRVFASGGMDVNHKDERYPSGDGDGAGETPDIVDNAFVVVDFAGGVRACLDLCMFAEDRQHEEVSVVGALGKVHAEAPACVVTHHTPTQRASGPAPSNPRVPPAPGTYEANTTTTTTSVDAKLSEAGFHEGATFFELQAFAAAVRAKAPAVVTAHDGLAAVAIGVAAELSIKEGRHIMLDEVMGAAQAATSSGTTADDSAKRRKVG